MGLPGGWNGLGDRGAWVRGLSKPRGGRGASEAKVAWAGVPLVGSAGRSFIHRPPFDALTALAGAELVHALDSARIAVLHLGAAAGRSRGARARNDRRQ